MKTFLSISILAASLLMATAATASTVYAVKSNSTYSAAKIPAQCTNCTINISTGVTLTIDEDIYLQNVSFNGGSIIDKGNDITFWSAGQFTNVTVTLSKTATLTNSGTLTITNSNFIFNNNAVATVYSSVNMVSSTWKFYDNANMEATGGTFSLKSSNLTAGDGTTTSQAYIQFNGANLKETDNSSSVSIANYNNYYYNWSNYSTSGKSVKTTDNKMNCGTSGKNACSSPVVYGPATLDFGGLASSSILPVKLTAFAIELSGNKVNISWTTDMERNSNRFEIERSTDGINWTSIGKVAAHGNISVATDYTFTDASLVSGTISYRLKMVDLDETYEYSPIKSVRIAAIETHEMRIYPNPATDYVMISSKGAPANVNIQLISMNGQILKQVNGSGANVNLSVSEFHSGNYIVRVSDATGAAQSFKLLIAK